MAEESAEQFFVNLLNSFRSLDIGRCSLFNPVVKNTIIGKEINLSMVEHNISQGLYSSNYWKFIEDVTMCFKFIQDNFISRMPIYKLAIDCKDNFDWKIERFMKSKGYCCGTWHVRKSKKIKCSSKYKCTVKSNEAYYRYSTYTFCKSCMKSLSNTNIKLEDNLYVNKADFAMFIYIDAEPEEFVKCKKCNKLFHERCVLYIRQSGIPYFCQKCRSKDPQLTTIRISSEKISKIECDSYIEDFLRQHNIPNCENIVVRMVCNIPTTFKIKPVIAKYLNEGFNQELSYNNCVIFVFLKLSDETEICFFGVYVQLYGNSKCPEPNKNLVYLSYIDSVKLCIVKERTKIYQYVLLGLFSYLKLKNFNRVFIWSCPPKRDVDYIFHEKPSDMKMPSKARLGDWYKQLMQMAVDENVAESFSGIKKYADENNWNDINNIPYLDSDMWPIRLEEAIVAAEKLVKKTPTDFMKTVNELMDVQTLGFDNQYFVLHLHSNIDKNIDAEFPDLIKGNWISNRSDLVDMFCDNKLEYSNERLAKFSTSFVLYRIFVDDSLCMFCGKISKSGVNCILMCFSCAENLERATIKKQRKFESDEPIILDDGVSTICDIIDIDDYEMNDMMITNGTNEEEPSSIRSMDYLDLTNDDCAYEFIETIQCD